MAKEKKIIKCLVKGIALMNIPLFLFSLLFITTIFITSNETNKGDEFGDLVTMGVPAELVPHFNEVSEMFNIPNWCLAAVAKQESNFNPNASYGGAYGLMQIQKVDPSTGKDLWNYLINLGLGQVYRENGYTFTNSEDMWNIFLNDSKAQIIAGAYEIRYYANYVLFKQNKIEILNYNSNENMSVVGWERDENDSDFRETLRRIFACYNGGPNYGMNVDLDNAQHDYPNKVFQYAMEFRKGGLASSGNEVIEKAIEAGMKWVDKSPYVWGGGRNQEDVDAGRFDCSSFIHYAYASAGVQLGDRASVTTDTLVKLGEEVNPNNIQRGDLIFFDTYKINGHVGIWLGDNKFLHDGTSTGVTVSEFKGYYVENFSGVIRRVISSE